MSRDWRQTLSATFLIGHRLLWGFAAADKVVYGVQPELAPSVSAAEALD
jgi:hypothetical protein